MRSRFYFDTFLFKPAIVLITSVNFNMTYASTPDRAYNGNGDRTVARRCDRQN
ncbi:hypothetical protein [Microcoleus sp. MON2_D5]|uniref:hypothetical protein n=1 Tax=Microcoleus sp. MON2_D5 TaxID=2818833 RepID=UPI002FD6306C